MTLKRSEPLPAAQNPKIAVDLPANARLRISQRFHGSNHIKGFRHEVIGWRRKTELDTTANLAIHSTGRSTLSS
nr:hypothetical protein [Deltaproteobacteria bacterium]